MFLSIYLSIYLSIWFYLSIYPSLGRMALPTKGTGLPWSLAWTELALSSYLYPSIYPSIYLSIYLILSIYLSIYLILSIYLSIYLSISREDGFADQGDWSPLDSGPSRADSFEYVMHGKIYRWVYLSGHSISTQPLLGKSWKSISPIFLNFLCLKIFIKHSLNQNLVFSDLRLLRYRCISFSLEAGPRII